MINKIIDALKKSDENTIVLLDKEKLEFYYIQMDELEAIENDMDKYNALRGYADEDPRYVELPRIYEFFDFVPAFVDSINDLESKKYLYEMTGEKSFKNRIRKLGIEELWYEFLEKKYYEIAYSFAIENEIIHEDISDSEIKELIELSSEVAILAPWNHFADLDHFRIHFEGHTIYYSILGQMGDCYGVEMYFDDLGLDGMILEQFFAIQDPSSIFPMVIRNSYNLYFDQYSDLSEPEREIMDHMGEDIEDGFYPSLMLVEIGNLPRLIQSKKDYLKFKMGLTALILFMREFNRKPRKLSKEEYTHFTVDIEKNCVKYRKDNNFPDTPKKTPIPRISDDELFEFHKQRKMNSHVFYVDLKAIPVPSDGAVPKAGFIPVVYDATNEKIISSTVSFANATDYATPIVKSLMKDYSNKYMGKTIVVRSPLMATWMNALFGDLANIETQEEPFESIEDYILGLMDDFSDRMLDRNAKPDFIS